MRCECCAERTSLGNGTLDFNEFKAVQQFLSNIQASFQYFDQSRTGRLSKPEVLRALHHAGFGHVDEAGGRGGGDPTDGRTSPLHSRAAHVQTKIQTEIQIFTRFPSTRLFCFISHILEVGAKKQTERNGTERKGTERNGTERNGMEWNGTKWNGTERHCVTGAVKSACQAFDPDRSNSLSLDQYIAMTMFLLGAKRAFEAFDPQRSAGSSTAVLTPPHTQVT